MAEITLGGNAVHTNGELPEQGAKAPAFELIKSDLMPVSSDDLAGQRVVLNIFPSVDTAVCATSVRAFNERAADLDDTTVVCVSADLPFAAARFCGAEGIENVVTGSTFRSSFLDDYGVRMTDGKLAGVAARAVVVLDGDGTVLHRELVPEIAQEPDYDAAIKVLQ
ncbi:thiol peroxidase [Acidimicrobiia bacterium EGI L10123]|uniref:thiol peroxidase n=1 Tax=Salinilacustrithrix flava TaxID=2957203 RepID=UPI003D7C2B85|nr:thiol peroxidase [Acidimicrobiia bacterium EGI L10123]